MNSFVQKHKKHWMDKKFSLSSCSALLLLAISLTVNHYAGQYATTNASNSVTDIILNNTRVYDFDGIFVYGSIVFWVFIGFLCAVEPKRIPFTIKSIALFVFIRSVFISLTHIGPFPTTIIVDSNLLRHFTFGADLFFSGHTGIPFLMALIFWKNIYLRILFILSSIVFGIVVLLAHLHYSIDVLSAFFITYTIYHMCVALWKKDKVFFDS